MRRLKYSVVFSISSTTMMPAYSVSIVVSSLDVEAFFLVTQLVVTFLLQGNPLWCRSLKHRYLCAKIPQPSNDDHFLIPLIETFPLVMQRYPIEGFLIASKLSEKNSRAHAKLAVVNILASIAGKKSAGCYSFDRNTLLCLLKRLYWRKVDINKIEWRIMFLVSIVAQIGDYWSKVRAKFSGTRLCNLYFVEPNIFTCFWASVVPIPAL